jgi:cell division protein FtsW (lipid II flippase)
MDLFTFVVSVALLGFAIQLDQFWIVFGATAILILASKDVKASLLLIFAVFVLYIINGIGMKEYWIIAVFGFLAIAYFLGLGKEEAPADPYAGLLGGMGGGMGGME